MKHRINKYDVLGIILKIFAIVFPIAVIGVTWWAFSLHSMWLFEQPLSQIWLTIQDKTVIDILVALMLLLALPYSAIFAIIWYIGLAKAVLD